MDIPRSLFEEKLEHMKESKGVKNDTDLTAADLKELVGQYKEVYLTAKGEPFPSGTRKSACSSIHPQSISSVCMKQVS
jgi:pyruvate,orthophosphate dikinase